MGYILGNILATSLRENWLPNSRLLFFLSCLALAIVPSFAVAQTTIPSTPTLYFQTSGPRALVRNGDWYTAQGTDAATRDLAKVCPNLPAGTSPPAGSALHCFVIEISEAQLAANGGSVTLKVNDVASNTSPPSVPDEINNTPDPTRFVLYNTNTLLKSQTYTSSDPATSTFDYTFATAGIYTLTSETGASHISGDTTAAPNNDDNFFNIEVSSSFPVLVGQYQSTVQTTANIASFNIYFGVSEAVEQACGANPLRLRNFDWDNGVTLRYLRPDGSSVAGTVSGNAVWNGTNNGDLNTGFDPVPINGQAGLWSIEVSGLGTRNQGLFEIQDCNGNLIPLYYQSVITDLAITKTANPTTVFVGQQLNYTLTVTNNGPLAVVASKVTDSFPSGLSNITWTCSADAGSTCSASGSGDIDDTVNLEVGDTLTYTVTATVNSSAAAELRNTAFVAPSVTDPATDNNSSTAVVNVNRPMDYGDAPASYGDASHIIPALTSPTVFLGQTQPDSEAGTQADDNATGADEDALSSLPSLAADATRYSLSIPCEGNGAAVAGWMDLNGDGDFLDTGERAPTTGTGICSDSNGSGPGSVVLTWGDGSADITPLAAGATTHVRLRTASVANQLTNPTGSADDGEVEDYTLTISSAPATGGVPFECTMDFLITINQGNSSQTLQRVDRVNNTYTFSQIGAATSGFRYNALGYNPRDNFLYAIAKNRRNSAPAGITNGALIRIDGNANVTPLGVPVPAAGVSGSFPANNSTNSGTFLNDGRLVVENGDGGAANQQFYVIDVTTSPPTFTLGPAIPTRTASFNDLAVNPLDDPAVPRVYAVNEATNPDQLVYFDPTDSNPVLTTVGTNTGTNINAGSAFFDTFGNFFFRSNSNNLLYRISLQGADAGKAVRVASASSGNNHDGAVCDSIGLTKDIASAVDQDTSDYDPTTNPAQVDVYAGSVVTYTYRIVNSSSTDAASGTFIDTMPSDGRGRRYIPANGVRVVAGNASALATEIFSNGDTAVAIPFSLAGRQSVTFEIDVKVSDDAPPNATTGTTDRVVINQAQLTGLNTPFPATVASDYPPSAAFQDPTPLTILPTAHVGVAKNRVSITGGPLTATPYTVTLDFYLENFSSVVEARAVSLVDNLDTVFGAGNYRVSAQPSLVAGANTLTLANNFDGSANQAIVTGGTLATNATAQIRVAVEVFIIGSFENQATVSGLNFPTDTSVNGTDPDGTDNDNNPDEQSPTPIVINQGTPFVCSTDFFITFDTSSASQALSTINRAATTSTFSTIGSATSGFRYNALGYNPVDNFLYAIVRDTTASAPAGITNGMVIRIDSSANIIPLGLPVPATGTSGSFPSDNASNAATFLEDGRYIVKHGNTGANQQFYIIDVTTTPPTFTRGANLSGAYLSDIAVNPLGNVAFPRAYAINEATNPDTLVYFDPTATGATLTTVGTNTGTNVNAGSAFFDAFGNFYFRSNASGDEALYRVDTTTGLATKVTSTPAGSNHDGAVCPSVGLSKDVSSTADQDTADYNATANPAEVDVPAGSVVTYSYRIANSSSSRPATGTFSDTMPSDGRGRTYIPANGVRVVAGSASGLGTKTFSNGDTSVSIPFTLGLRESITFEIDVLVPASAPPNSTSDPVVTNQAQLTGVSGASSSTVLSDYPASPAFQDPTPLTILPTPRLGLAKFVYSNIVSNGDGSYNVPFTLVVQNAGNVPLTNVTISDDLDAAFGAGNYIINSAPNQVSGPALTLNSGFTGNGANTTLVSGGSLAVGEEARIVFILRVTPDDNGATDFNQVSGAATSASGNVSDLSQNGLDPDPDGNFDPTDNNEKTPVDYGPQAILGVAKSASTPVAQGDGTFTVTFTITLENLGGVRLTEIELKDNLNPTFNASSHDCTTSPTSSYCVVAGSINSPNLLINPAFTGDATGTAAANDALVSASSVNDIAVGQSKSLSFSVNFNPKNQLNFENSAIASSKETPDDISTNGNDPDPDGNGQPSEQIPTPFSVPEKTQLGLAKVVRAVSNNVGTTAAPAYDVTYAIYAENSGNVALNDVQLTDNLLTTFNRVSDVQVTSVSRTAGKALTLNSNYNGKNDINLLASGQELKSAESITLRLVVRVTVDVNASDPYGVATPFVNQATGAGTSPSGTAATDKSDDGDADPTDNIAPALNPDLDNNGDPTDNNDPTPVSFVPPLAGASDVNVVKRVAVCGSGAQTVATCLNNRNAFAATQEASPGAYLLYEVIFTNNAGLVTNAEIEDEILQPTIYQDAASDVTGVTVEGGAVIQCRELSGSYAACVSNASLLRLIRLIDSTNSSGNGLRLTSGQSMTLRFVVRIP